MLQLSLHGGSPCTISSRHASKGVAMHRAGNMYCVCVPSLLPVGRSTGDPEMVAIGCHLFCRFEGPREVAEMHPLSPPPVPSYISENRMPSIRGVL